MYSASCRGGVSETSIKPSYKEGNALIASAGSDWTSLPAGGQIEVTLFGPGFGESAAIHLGGGKWIVIDCCLDPATREPAVLKYFREIGVPPETAVQRIIATHWHDDHIRGMAQLVERCASAKFCCSSALGAAEFLAMVDAYKTRPMIAGGPGVREIDAVFSVLQARRQAAMRAIANRLVLELDGSQTGHGWPCSVKTLSPSDKQVELFYHELKSLIPGIETKRRCAPQGPNHLTVVAWIQIGPVAMLLGGDLEETSDSDLGWTAIVTSTERPTEKAIVFKVPHHGSQNAHHEGVWREMLTADPYSILTPWNRGTKLPTSDDVA